jgi:hypothetical protein
MNKIYTPMYLSWAKSYEQEIAEFKELISTKPADVRLLKQELKNLINRGERCTYVNG